MQPQFALDLNEEIIVDNFSGGGGVSTGIYLALGRHTDVAVNHWDAAIRMHARNHPQTLHLREDVRAVDAKRVANGRRIGLVWLSPDCRHHSRAKGGKPVNKNIRGLAWVALKWAACGARVILLENVPEIVSWTRLVAKRDPETGRVVRVDGTVAPKGERTPLGQQMLEPDKQRLGAYFRAWTRELTKLGYVVEHRVLCMADYGAPTTRTRLFVCARRDGRPIVWPTPTHGHPHHLRTQARHVKPWNTAAEHIDFSIPCASIFLSRDEAKQVGVRRPLAAATVQRIGTGVVRYVVEADLPFIVEHHARRASSSKRRPTGAARSAASRPGAPAKQVQRSAGVPSDAVRAAFLVKHYTGVVGYSLHGQPMHTITARDHHALCVVQLVPATSACMPGAARIEAIRELLTACGFRNKDTDPSLVRFKGTTYRIVDIGVRMLRPAELYSASGFPREYVIGDDEAEGLSLTTEQQIALVGNAVPPPMVQALVHANCSDLAVRAMAA